MVYADALDVIAGTGSERALRATLRRLGALNEEQLVASAEPACWLTLTLTLSLTLSLTPTPNPNPNPNPNLERGAARRVRRTGVLANPNPDLDPNPNPDLDPNPYP